MSAISAEQNVYLLEAADEVENGGTGIRASRCSTEMRAATEGTRFVNKALGRGRVQEWADPLGNRWQALPASRSERLGRKQGFASREVRDLARELELTTL